MRMKESVNTLVDFIEEYERITKREYKNTEIRLYYRGENADNKDTKCLPSLFRTSSNNEKDTYYKFLRRHPDDFKGLSNLDILSKMQHYGICTRMLDVTTSPLVALFFACYGDESASDGHVYIFKSQRDRILTYDSDKALLLATLPKTSVIEQKLIKQFTSKYDSEEITPKTLNDESVDSNQRKALGKLIYECERERDAFKEHHVVPSHLHSIYFVKPQFTSMRMKLQNSLFMLFGLSSFPEKSDKEYFEGKVTKKDVIDIVISSNSKKRILSELKFVCGISYSSLFGDIDSTVREDKNELYETYIGFVNVKSKKDSVK